MAEQYPGLLRCLARDGARPRKYWVNTKVLERAMGSGEPTDAEHELADLRARVDVMDRKLEALKSAYRALKKQVSAHGQAPAVPLSRAA